jgi:hypothetical protein
MTKHKSQPRRLAFVVLKRCQVLRGSALWDGAGQDKRLLPDNTVEFRQYRADFIDCLDLWLFFCFIMTICPRQFRQRWRRKDYIIIGWDFDLIIL